MDQQTRPRPGPAGIAIAGAGIALICVIAYCGMIPDQADVTSAARATAYELERTPVQGLGINIFDVQQALSMGARRGASNIKVRDAGRDADKNDLYEFTNSRGDYPVCMTVHLDIDLLDDSPSFPSATVEQGRCPG
ncbi:hypothetical protein ACPPVO_06795 [Dactylosporangium sp. McL0621]|uniref:hypothetical protein n=1 Tax=Dactylosporangium sp. McL0621 TaxID=3415678 RepID=UPI003CED5FEB